MNTNVLLYVVGGNNHDPLEDVRNEFQILLHEKSLLNALKLVVINEQSGVESPLTEDVVRRALEIDDGETPTVPGAGPLVQVIRVNAMRVDDCTRLTSTICEFFHRQLKL